MDVTGYRNSWFIIIAATIILAFAFQGSRGLWEPDEGRYVRCAYEMLQSGDWLTPRLNGNPHFSKPPFTYWTIASGLSLFGMNEWGARFFHAVAFVFTALMVSALGSRMWDQRTGLLAGFIYSTMILPYIAANTVTTDMILTCFETAAICCFMFSITKQQNKSWTKNIWLLSMWGFLGLAFLTKGPPGLIPLAVIVIYLFFTNMKILLNPFAIIAGILIFTAVSLPWYILVIQKYSGLLSYFLKDEIIGRIFTGEHTRNPGFFGACKIYPHTLLLGSLPWSYFLFLTARKVRPPICTAYWWKQLRTRENAFFIFLWFFVPLAILSIANSRLPFYVLPLFVPLALAIARSLLLYFPEKTSAAFLMQGKPAVYIMLLICFLTGSRAIAAHYGPRRDSRFIWEKLNTLIKKHIGETPYELSFIGLNYNGLTFYSGKMIDALVIEEDKDHPFFPKKNIKQKCDELTSSMRAHVFLLSRRNVAKANSELESKGFTCLVDDGPFDYKLIFCQRTVVGNSLAVQPPTQSLNP